MHKDGTLADRKSTTSKFVFTLMGVKSGSNTNNTNWVTWTLSLDLCAEIPHVICCTKFNFNMIIVISDLTIVKISRSLYEFLVTPTSKPTEQSWSWWWWNNVLVLTVSLIDGKKTTVKQKTYCHVHLHSIITCYLFIVYHSVCQFVCFLVTLINNCSLKMECILPIYYTWDDFLWG